MTRPTGLLQLGSQRGHLQLSCPLPVVKQQPTERWIPSTMRSFQGPILIAPTLPASFRLASPPSSSRLQRKACLPSHGLPPSYVTWLHPYPWPHIETPLLARRSRASSSIIARGCNLIHVPPISPPSDGHGHLGMLQPAISFFPHPLGGILILPLLLPSPISPPHHRLFIPLPIWIPHPWP